MTDTVDIQKFKTCNFGEIADFLLNNCTLNTQKTTYRICEIEFYLHAKTHKDAYTHCDKEQLSYGYFYFHRINGKGFKAGTYKCFDLVFGDELEGKYFGILIRSLLNLSTNEFIEGPCRSLSAILAEYNFKEVKEFIGDGKQMLITDDNSKMRLKLDDTLKKEQIFKGERIGLSDKFPQFQLKKYRFLIFDKKIKKGKKSLVKLEY